MSTLRGVGDFELLWKRLTTILVENTTIDLLAIEDLVQAKKTQRDKDWPMIRRLLEQAYFSSPLPLEEAQIIFLLRELRTPGLLLPADLNVDFRLIDRLDFVRQRHGRAMGP